jgi:sec-independent protein translocase protein TatB
VNILGMNIDWFKFLILLIVGLVVVGPEKLPSYARKAAKVIRNFEKVTKVVTGQITQALDMDDDGGGKSAGFKQDLMAVKRTLEADVAELKSALESQAKSITDTVESTTKETAAVFEKQAKDISEAVSTEVAGINTTLQDQAKIVSETIETGIDPPSTVKQPVSEAAPANEASSEIKAPVMQDENLETSPQQFSPAGEP